MIGVQTATGAIIPEDIEGGVPFMIYLNTATTSSTTDTPLHLIKIYGVPDGAELSVGAYVPASGSERAFWVVTEDSIKDPVKIVGLDEHFSGDITLSAQAVASLVKGVGVFTLSQPTE